MEIPKGYKQTEVGIIPEDWNVRKLGQLCKVNGRIGFRGYTRKDLVRQGDGAYAIGGKHITHNKLDLSDADYISWSKYYESPEIMVQYGDIVFAQRGTLGRSAIIDKHIGEATINPSLVLLNKIQCNNWYLILFLQSRFVDDWINAVSAQTSIPMLSQKQIESIDVILPPINEQERIVASLSEIDELIAGLGEQIEKKRQIKEGAMQQLLTGKTRLPGFDGEWNNVSICKILTIGNGRDYKHLQGGDVPVYGTGGVITYVNEWLYDGDTVCIGRKGTIDKPMFSHGKIWTVDTLFYTYDYIDSYPKFIYYLFDTIDWLSYNEATGVPSLSKANIEKIEVCIPHYNEQVTIANILTTMDDEIRQLEAERDKYTLIKQGMMQELLTGKTRLV